MNDLSNFLAGVTSPTSAPALWKEWGLPGLVGALSDVCMDPVGSEFSASRKIQLTNL